MSYVQILHAGRCESGQDVPQRSPEWTPLVSRWKESNTACAYIKMFEKNCNLCGH